MVFGREEGGVRLIVVLWSFFGVRQRMNMDCADIAIEGSLARFMEFVDVR